MWKCGEDRFWKFGFRSAKETFSHSFSSNHLLPLESLRTVFSVPEEKNRESGHGKVEAKSEATQPQIKEGLELPEAGSGEEGFPLEPSAERQPYQDLNSWLLVSKTVKEYIFLLLSL